VVFICRQSLFKHADWPLYRKFQSCIISAIVAYQSNFKARTLIGCLRPSIDNLPSCPSHKWSFFSKSQVVFSAVWNSDWLLPADRLSTNFTAAKKNDHRSFLLPGLFNAWRVALNNKSVVFCQQFSQGPLKVRFAWSGLVGAPKVKMSKVDRSLWSGLAAFFTLLALFYSHFWFTKR
jgi:hypothetical protein